MRSFPFGKSLAHGRRGPTSRGEGKALYGGRALDPATTRPLNITRRLKTLSGLTLYEYIAKIWTAEPERFIVNPIHLIPGPTRELGFEGLDNLAVRRRVEGCAVEGRRRRAGAVSLTLTFLH